jgi:hypothetical protein
MMGTNRLRQAARVLAGRPATPNETFEDMGPGFHELRALVAPFTMTGPERLLALHEAVKYIVDGEIPGAYVECGVWRGGSSMMAALTFESLGERRPLWLYDTFEGMTEPGEEDVKWSGESAASELAKAARRANARTTWSYATLEDVTANMGTTGYPGDLIRYVPGKVEDTIPAQAPDAIALLRLDTDWYESTRHELEHLWSRVSPRGVLIVDDYGHWQGARKAVDEFFAAQPLRPLLVRVDYTGRIAVKP